MPDPLDLDSRERSFLAVGGGAHADVYSERRVEVVWRPQGFDRRSIDGAAFRRLGAAGDEELRVESPGARGPDGLSRDLAAELEAEAEHALGRALELGLTPLSIRVWRRRIRVAVEAFAREREERGLTLEAKAGSRTLLRSAPDAGGLRLERLEAAAGAPLALSTPAPVLLLGQAASVLLHELVGHGCEHGLSGEPPLLGQGETVGPEDLFLSDDPGLGGRGGSQAFDDEGSEASPRLLVEAGRVKGSLGDRRAAFLFASSGPGASGASGSLPGAVLAGRGRREGFRSPPLPRLTNLVARPGRARLETLRLEAACEVPRAAAGEASRDGRRARLHAGAVWQDGVRRGPAWITVELAALRGAVLGDVVEVDRLGLCGRDGQEVSVSGEAPALLVEATLEPR